MEKDPKILEEEAHSYLVQEKFDQAFKLFSEAADIYKSKGKHKQAALCFASAASCWGIKSGEKTFYNAALSYKEAAEEAELAGDPEYASLLYKYAAINYEKDGEFIEFSECFYRSKESYRKFLAYRLINLRKIYCISKHQEQRGFKGAVRRLFLWLVLTFSYLIWGHGERPARTLYCAILIIFLSAFLYSLGYLSQNGTIFKPDFFESVYFSTVTFTTVGYGDITPIGFSKLIGMTEALCGIFVMPLFIVALSRRYLRV